MFLKTILLSAVTLVVLVVATENKSKPLHQQPVERDQKTFQHIQNILRNNYERSLRQDHLRRRNSRFLGPRAFSKPAVRRSRKISPAQSKVGFISTISTPFITLDITLVSKNSPWP